MRALLGTLLLAASMGAQVPTVTGLGSPAAGPASPAAGRGRAQAPGTRANPAAAGRGAAGIAGSPQDLKFAPLRTIQAPIPVTFTLPNGMKVYLQEDHDLPLVSGIALVRTGGLWDPPQRIGLARLAGMVMRTGGTALKTGEQVDTLLDNAGATLEAAIGDSHGTFSFTGLKAYAPVTLQLFKEVLTQPGFRPDRLELAKSQLRAGISHRNDNGSAIARREFSNLIYGKDEPFGWREEYATIARISRNDLRTFHQRYFFPANITLGVCGDFSVEEMKASIEKLFADWTVRQPAVPELAKVRNTPSPGVYLAEKKDTPQTSFFTIGHLGGLRSDKDNAALEILAGILGGGHQSRIAQRLRGKLGIPNEVSAAWNGGYGYPGLFEISGSTKTTSTVPTIQAIQEEIDRIRTAEVTEDEWRNARDAAVNSLVFGNDTRPKLFARQIMLDYYGYPKDYLALSQSALQTVTRADLLRVAKQSLNPANLTVTVVANPAMLGEPLEKLGKVAKLNIDIPEAKSETVQSSDAGIAEGKQILLKAQAAAGGAGNLAAVKDYVTTAEFLISPGVPNIGGSKIVQTDRWVAPTTFRQEATVATGRVAAYTDGQTGWFAAPQGWGALSGVQRSQILGDLFRVYYRLLLSDRLEGRTVNAIDAFTVQIADAAGQVASVEFDSATYLTRRVTYDTPQPAGPPVYSEEVYEDFRDVSGIKVPFKITISQGGRRFSDAAVKDYRINTGLNPLEIARRPQ